MDYNISEADLQNQNPVEGVIQYLRRKWYIITIKQRVLKKFWDYILRWISETLSLNNYTAGRSTDGGHTPLDQVTGDTAKTSEYLDFGFMISGIRYVRR